MKKSAAFVIITFILFSPVLKANTVSEAQKGRSVYQLRPEDPEAVYFSAPGFNIKADGETDVTDALQEAVNRVKTQKNFGIVFIPEGKYLITKTIYIPQAVRLIGYGKNRPQIVLGKNSPGFQTPDSTDKGRANYMFWFTSRMKEKDQAVRDAGAGTFYSALSNIDLKIEEGNPAAVALRTHFAQHSFISHCDINIGDGKAGIFDAGNEIEDVRFFGGSYGIYTTKTSPGWQYLMIDTYFEGQRITAVKTQEAGLTIIRMSVKDVPSVIQVDPNYWEKLYMENSRFENVKGPALVISDEGNGNNQISLRNVECRNVPVIASFRRSGKETPGAGKIYRINDFICGLQMDELGSDAEDKTVLKTEILNSFSAGPEKDIPDLPEMESWANLKSLGAKGDGETDDTQVLQSAIDKYENIYIPQGWYRVSETIKLKQNTKLIGLNPIATQILLADNTPGFGSFGSPRPMVEVPEGGKNIITGIGLSTGARNNRAVACKWMAGAGSYMNDVKFIGGHGTMNRGPINAPQQPRQNQPAIDPAWDTQYWSLWITNGGGGVFKDIWSASTYAASGIYISNTSAQGRIYAMSVEHHVRNEVRFKNVSNWKVYALQLEEESRESWNCQPLEIEKCSDMLFANLYMFRVIRMISPYPYSARTWDCSRVEFLNVHNYSQIKYTTSLPLYDITNDIQVRPMEFTRLYISGKLKPALKEDNQIKKLARGFEFAEGACRDSKGNIYFSEQRWKRIYKWNHETNTLSMVADFPWEPLSLACDTKDNLLVVFKYWPQPGYIVNGRPEAFTNPEDAGGTSFSMWGNSGFATFVYSINPGQPEESIKMLSKEKMPPAREFAKALYPSNRWRDWHDFDEISVRKADECWVAPDGVTIIPVCYDLARSGALIEAVPGRPLYASDEYDKRTVKFEVTSEGYLSKPEYFVEKGEFSAVTDNDGNVYVADGEVYVFDKSGKVIDMIKVPQRPVTIALGGSDMKTLYITTASELYSIKVKDYTKQSNL